MAFNRKNLEEVERHIRCCKDTPVVITPHNNNYYISLLGVKCGKCNVDMDCEVGRNYINTQEVECNVCGNKGRLTTLNVIQN